MKTQEYLASIQKDKGRSGWCLIFRHPLRAKRDGFKGLRVRIVLGTTDENEARKLAEEMNVLLNDPSYHNLAARERAAKEFNPKIIDAFFEDLTPALRDSWSIRSSRISFPGPEEGYARVLMVGTTGAGKTTLVRQLIGSDPMKDRFPSISPAKTTIADIEIITGEGLYKAVVTFIDQDRVRKYIEECIAASTIGFFETRNYSELLRRFLIHTEQRFRLSYLLGTLTSQVQTTDEDDVKDEDEQLDQELSQLSTEEQEKLKANLHSYIDRIKLLAEGVASDAVLIAKENGIDLKMSPKEDIEAVYELVEENLYDRHEFHDLVDEIANDIETRFDFLTEGELTKGKTGWPSLWYYESDSREDFIRLVNTFSSNYAPRFGRLLTPLVDGIRVFGNFTPAWTDNQIKLALMDGEGLGHTPDSISSISTTITNKYSNAEAIVLVDNASQPMQGGSLAVLSSLASRGYESKLIVCFTHFEHVIGDNLPNYIERQSQVLASVDNAIVSVGNKLDESVTRALRTLVPKRIIFLSGIQEALSEGSKRTKQELNRLISTIEELMIPPKPVNVVPIYDDANLVLNIQKSVQQFHDRWRARLKLQYHATIPPEHWSRIKALTRRLGEFGENQYQELRPVADLIQDLLNGFNIFIAKPLKWEPSMVADDIQQQAKANIKQQLDSRLEAYISKSLHIERINEWYDAYIPRGKDSTIKRARIVQGIYDYASPIPGEIPSPDLNRFLKDLRTIVKESINAAGGKIDVI